MDHGIDHGRHQRRILLLDIMMRVALIDGGGRRPGALAPQPAAAAIPPIAPIPPIPAPIPPIPPIPAAAQPQIPQRRRRHPRIHRNRVSPLGMTAQQALTTYRFDMPTIVVMLAEIEADIAPAINISTAVPPLLKLLSVLQFCATGSFQHCTSLLHGMAQSTFSAILVQVMGAMLRRVRKHIYMPRTLAEFDATKAGLYAIAHFPQLAGCVDGTHIPMAPPSDTEQAYRNRKSSHSMNVQMVCDASLCFLSVCARYPGSSHDARILRASSLCTFMEQRAPPRTVLLGKLS